MVSVWLWWSNEHDLLAVGGCMPFLQTSAILLVQKHPEDLKGGSDTDANPVHITSPHLRGRVINGDYIYIYIYIYMSYCRSSVCSADHFWPILFHCRFAGGYGLIFLHHRAHKNSTVLAGPWMGAAAWIWDASRLIYLNSKYKGSDGRA